MGLVGTVGFAEVALGGLGGSGVIGTLRGFATAALAGGLKLTPNFLKYILENLIDLSFRCFYCGNRVAVSMHILQSLFFGSYVIIIFFPIFFLIISK